MAALKPKTRGKKFGEKLTLAAAMGTAFTRGIQETEMDGRRPEAVAKHFLGFHSSLGGIHEASVDAGERVMREIYPSPFRRLGGGNQIFIPEVDALWFGN